MAGTTLNYDIPKPNRDAAPAEKIDEAVDVVAAAIDQMDALFKAHADAIAAKAAAAHAHTIGDITSLQAALDAKMAANATFGIDWLTDVSGATAASDGYVLIKSGGVWIPASAAAAIGAHGHSIGEVTGLGDALGAKLNLDGGNIGGGAGTLLTALGLSSYVQTLKGAASAAALRPLIGLLGSMVVIRRILSFEDVNVYTTSSGTVYGTSGSFISGGVTRQSATSKLLVIALAEVRASQGSGNVARWQGALHYYDGTAFQIAPHAFGPLLGAAATGASSMTGYGVAANTAILTQSHLRSDTPDNWLPRFRFNLSAGASVEMRQASFLCVEYEEIS